MGGVNNGLMEFERSGTAAVVALEWLSPSGVLKQVGTDPWGFKSVYGKTVDGIY